MREGRSQTSASSLKPDTYPSGTTPFHPEMKEAATLLCDCSLLSKSIAEFGESRKFKKRCTLQSRRFPAIIKAKRTIAPQKWLPQSRTFPFTGRLPCCRRVDIFFISFHVKRKVRSARNSASCGARCFFCGIPKFQPVFPAFCRGRKQEKPGRPFCPPGFLWFFFKFSRQVSFNPLLRRS